MSVYILDPGFVGEGGHHLAMNRFISSWLKDRGHDVTVLANQNYQPSQDWGFRLVKPFQWSPYTGRLGVDINLGLFITSNKQVFEFLSKGLTSARIPEGSVFLMHTGFDLHLRGIAEWFKALNRPDLKIRILLRFPPTLNYDDFDIAKAISKFTLKHWEGVPGDLRFFTDLDSLSEYYESYSAFRFKTTPIALHFESMPNAEASPPLEGRGLHFVYAGGHYPAKGAHLLPEAIRNHSEKYPEDRYTIQVPQGETQFIEPLLAASPNVTILSKILHGDDFYQYLLQGDVTFIAYDAYEYALRTSHIMMESLGLGRMIITSENTWMSTQLHQIGISVGAVMPTYDPEGLTSAMAKCKRNALKYSDNALFIAPYIRRRHNAERWMDVMLEGTGLVDDE